MYKSLENGFQIIYEKPESLIPISCIILVCNIGSIHMPAQLRGASHFIEHMCFRGTKNNPNANKLLIKYNDMGAKYNAYSSQKHTIFVVKCQDIHVEKCIHLLSDQLLSSLFEVKSFKREENVVIAENVNDSDKPEVILSNATMELLYEGTPFQYPVDDISFHKTKYNYRQVYDFYKEHYNPSNLILSITTNLPFANILKGVKASGFSKGSCHRRRDTIVQQLIKPNHKFISNKKLNSTFLNVSFKTCDQLNNDKYCLNLLSDILCNGLTSRLVQLLRHKYGIVYYINSSTDYNSSGGEFIITTQCDSGLLTKKTGVLPLLMNELKKLKKYGVTQKEVTHAKNYLKGQRLLQLEDCETQTMYNGVILLYTPPADIVPYSKVFDVYYEPITKEDINACIRKYISSERMCLTVLGK